MLTKFSPSIDNLGKKCQYWEINEGCHYPSFELLGRKACNGIIDDTCLWVLGKASKPISINESKVQIQTAPEKPKLPPKNI